MEDFFEIIGDLIMALFDNPKGFFIGLIVICIGVGLYFWLR